MGVCATTVPACVGGMMQTCTPGPGGAETCNGLDDDCDGATDDGIAPITCGVGACTAMVPGCMGGMVPTCTPGPASAESCNGIDDDCDGMVDQGLGTLTCGMGLCTNTVPACVGGMMQTCTPLPGTAETCNGMDDDCDGTTDEGNPGGGVACGGADVGACMARTSCVGGVLVCRGTFVAPPSLGGSPTGAGSRVSPLSSIVSAQGNAAILGGGADVCVCAGATAARFSENVTMVEGTSVLGGYDCATWTRAPLRTTIIADTDFDGVAIGAAITPITAIESMTVEGLDTTVGLSTAGITITGGQPTLTDVIVAGGDTAGTSVGIECTGCGARMTRVQSNGGLAPMLGMGLHGTGALGMLSTMMGSFGGGVTSSGSSSSFGVRLESCSGAPTFTGTSTFGGGSPPGGVPVGTRTGFDATGAMCAPVVTAGAHRGCEIGGQTCIGVSCTTGSQCVVTGAVPTGIGAGGIRGTTGTVATAYGMRCLSGGCATVSGNQIFAGNTSGRSSVGMEIDGSSPIVDDNQITGPGGPGFAPSTLYYSLSLRMTSATITNNVILGGSVAQPSDVVHYDMAAIGPVFLYAIVHSNTIQYSACTGCGARVGLGLQTAGSAGGAPMGIFRNNVIEHGGVGGVTRPVVEYGLFADPLTFENNDLFDPNAAGAEYRDEGTMNLGVAAVNALGPGYGGNIAADCQLDPTWHLPATSMCIDAGTANGPPGAPPMTDFDGQRRPRSAIPPLRYDIGADEV
jgi:hypothetical protein